MQVCFLFKCLIKSATRFIHSQEHLQWKGYSIVLVPSVHAVGSAAE